MMSEETTEPFGRLTTSDGEVEIKDKETLDVAKKLLTVLENRFETKSDKEARDDG